MSAGVPRAAALAALLLLTGGPVAAQTVEQTGVGKALEALQFKDLRKALDEQWQGPIGDAAKYGMGTVGTWTAIALAAEAAKTLQLSGRVTRRGARRGGGGTTADDDDPTTATSTSTATATQ